MKGKEKLRVIYLGAQQFHEMTDTQARELIKKLVDAGCWYLRAEDEQ